MGVGNPMGTGILWESDEDGNSDTAHNRNGNGNGNNAAEMGIGVLLICEKNHRMRCRIN